MSSPMDNMPNFESLFRSSSSKSQNLSINELEKMLRSSGNSPKASRQPSLSNLFISPPKKKSMPKKAASPKAASPKPMVMPQFSLSLNNFFSPPKKSPSPQKVSSPDRKFAHLHPGTNSGNKDSMGRIIWHGPRGGRFVISTIGKRVPYHDDDTKLKEKVVKGTNKNSGMVDKKGRKIFIGKSGGKYVITEAGRRTNPST